MEKQSNRLNNCNRMQSNINYRCCCYYHHSLFKCFLSKCYSRYCLLDQ